MKKQTKEDLRWLIRFTLQLVLATLIFVAAFVGIAAIVDALAPIAGAALWGVWEAVMGL